MINKNEKYDLMMDFYEIAMANGFIVNGMEDTIGYFDMFFRPSKEIGGFCIMAGTQQLCECLATLEFDESDIEFIREKGASEAFVDYLRNFEFKCDVWAVPEGTPIFPGEPIVKVKGPVLQGLLIETMVLLTINHQSLIATKANRIVRAAQGRSVVEFGTRRAHGVQAAVLGARAAYIGGCTATTNAQAAKLFDLPVFGGMSHSWIQAFDSELSSFCAYAREYPDSCVLLIDTYDVLNSGLPNAIKAFNSELVPKGFRPKGIRIDSGDLAYLSKKIRRILNDAGFPDCDIYASNSLDEYIIREMLGHGARVDSFLVGERLITSAGSPMFGGSYKLSAVEKNGEIKNRIEISENVSKITTPCSKLLWRLFDMETGKAIADLLTLEDEDISELTTYELFDPDYSWKRKTVSNFVARKLLEPIFANGKQVYSSPSIGEIKAYCSEQVDSLWEEVLRFEYPHNYYVDLSKRLWDEKQRLIESGRNPKNN